jgi:hypothetical protein
MRKFTNKTNSVLVGLVSSGIVEIEMNFGTADAQFRQTWVSVIFGFCFKRIWVLISLPPPSSSTTPPSTLYYKFHDSLLNVYLGQILLNFLRAWFTNIRNKQVFIYSTAFHTSLIFVSKAVAYPSKAPFRCSTLGQAPSLTKVEWPAWDKLSSLLGSLVNYGSNKFYDLGSWLYHKCFRMML